MTLYISDLDGTLLNSRAELSDVSRDLLREMLGDGLLFTVASARSVSSIRQMLEGLALNLPVIEFNGAFISDLESGRHQIVNAIDPVITPELFQLMSQNGCVPYISTFNGVEDCLYYPDPTNLGMRWYYQDRKSNADPRLRKSENISASLKEHVVCFTAIGEQHKLAELAGRISEIYGNQLELHLIENHYSPGWYWLTAHDYRATKDQAIQELRGAFGLGEKELIVFGDQINDLKMFEIAKEAVAVKNAVPDLKKRATRVIGHNDHDSVAKYIYEHRRNSGRA
ncbi:MAG: HAD hydrolase family protein [Gammaproteobacteria bacterium]|jgi:hypothetical protein